MINDVLGADGGEVYIPNNDLCSARDTSRNDSIAHIFSHVRFIFPVTQWLRLGLFVITASPRYCECQKCCQQIWWENRFSANLQWSAGTVVAMGGAQPLRRQPEKFLRQLPRTYVNLVFETVDVRGQRGLMKTDGFPVHNGKRQTRVMRTCSLHWSTKQYIIAAGPPQRWR